MMKPRLRASRKYLRGERAGGAPVQASRIAVTTFEWVDFLMAKAKGLSTATPVCPLWTLPELVGISAECFLLCLANIFPYSALVHSAVYTNLDGAERCALEFLSTSLGSITPQQVVASSVN